MKLLFCPDCTDVRKLHTTRVACACGASWGRYRADGQRAVVGGKAVIFGLHNRDIAEAVLARDDQPATVRAWRFTSAYPFITRGEMTE